MSNYMYNTTRLDENDAYIIYFPQLTSFIMFSKDGF